tara:strand:- start:66 stop:821 length:756 start_codon:yes stop_codon:yes gene_type:complete
MIKMFKKIYNILYLRIIFYFVNKSKNFPAEITDEERKIIEVSDNYSMTGTIRMWALLQSIKNVIQNKIEGDIVECGVWKGGNLILSQKYLNSRNNKKEIYGFDTFGGMTEPEEVDVDYRSIPASDMHLLHKKKDDKENGWAFCSLADVNKNLNDTVPNNNINLIEGKVEETLLNEKNLPNKISILRLDTDWYASTKIELEILYPRLMSGGFLIIDDYGHFKGCKKAVDEYFKDKMPYLHYVDYTCRLIIKP